MDSKFTVMASDALKLAKRTARSLKLNYVGTEHILMGLILEDGCVASRTHDGHDKRPYRARQQRTYT